MDSRASTFLKHLFSAVPAMLNAKALAVKSKTRAFNVRIVIIRLLRSKKILLKAINYKTNDFPISQEPSEERQSSFQEHHSRSMALDNAARDEAPATLTETEPTAAAAIEDISDEHPLFELEDEDFDDH